MRKALVLAVLGGVLLVAACGGGGAAKNASPALGGGGGGSFCDSLKADAALLKDVGSKTSIDQIAAAVTDLVNKAPTEIKADMQTLADGIKQVASLESQLSANPSAASSLGSDFDAESGKFDAADAHIAAFAKTNCGFDLNSGSSSSSDVFGTSDSSSSDSSS